MKSNSVDNKTFNDNVKITLCDINILNGNIKKLTGFQLLRLSASLPASISWVLGYRERKQEAGRGGATWPRYAEDELDLIYRTRQEEVYEEEEASGLVYTISGMLKVVEVTWSRCDWSVDRLVLRSWMNNMQPFSDWAGLL